MEEIEEFKKKLQSASDAEIIDLFLSRYDLVSDQKIEAVIVVVRNRCLIDEQNRMIPDEERAILLKNKQKEETLKQVRSRSDFSPSKPSAYKNQQKQSGIGTVFTVESTKQADNKAIPAAVKIYSILGFFFIALEILSFVWIPLQYFYRGATTIFVTAFHGNYLVILSILIALVGLRKMKVWAFYMYSIFQLLDILYLVQFYSFAMVIIKFFVIFMLLYHFQDKMPSAVQHQIQKIPFLRKKRT